MSRIVAGLIVVSILGSLLAIAASRDSQEVAILEHLIVHETLPERLIRHEVDWKGVIEPDRIQSMLVGPRMFSAGLRKASEPAHEILFSWYEMPPQAGPQRMQVDVWSGDGTKSEYEVADAAYFLSKTQRLDTGEPADLPKSLGHYVAYRIVDHSYDPSQLTVPTGEGIAEYELKKPALICLPVEEWHHHEHFAVSNVAACWVVYEISEVENSTAVSTLDQFGLNRLKLESAKWLCVPAAKYHVSARTL